MQRYNGRLYRLVWTIVQNEQDAEDVVQETYVRAYEHLAQFAGRSLFSTWLTKIAIHEAWSRKRRRVRERGMESSAASIRNATRLTHTPEHHLLTTEARTLLEEAINALPEALRSVFVMRSCEGMSMTEIANVLEISKEAARMRFLRARRLLRQSLYNRASATGSKAFQFLGDRCDRLTANVLMRIAYYGRPQEQTATTRASIERYRAPLVHSGPKINSCCSD